MYTGYIDFKNRLLLGNPISTISTRAYQNHDECVKALDSLVKLIQPMDDVYCTCIVEHS